MISDWFKTLFQSWESQYLSQSIDHADLKRRMEYLNNRRSLPLLHLYLN